MALTDSLLEGAAALKRLAEQMRQLSVEPIRIEVEAAGSSDRGEADAIKRGQRPEQLAAIKRALGL